MLWSMLRLKSVVCNDANNIAKNKKNKAWDSGRVRLGICLLVGIRVFLSCMFDRSSSSSIMNECSGWMED